MPIYKEMYIKLFRQVSKTIKELQEIQQECERMYTEAKPGPPINILDRKEDTGTETDG